MLAFLILGLVFCESVASFKFNKFTENHDRDTYYPSNDYDNKVVILNEQKKSIIMKKENLDRKVENIERQKENLDRDIENFDRQKEYFDREKEKIDRQIESLDREINMINKIKENFDRNIESLNRQKEDLDYQIEKIDLEIEKQNIDRDRYTIRRAAVEGNEYTITINLPGYNEKEIIVKSRRGRLVVQAIHDVFGEPKMSFQNFRNLPDFVLENGSWSYKYGVLRIVFPVVRRTGYAKKVVNRNGVIRKSKGDWEKIYTTSSTEKSKVPMENNEMEPTTYISNQEFDIKTNPHVSGGDEENENKEDKNEEDKVEASTQIVYPVIPPTGYGKKVLNRNGVIHKLKNNVEKIYTTSSTEKSKVPMDDNEMETTTSISNQEFDIKTNPHVREGDEENENKDDKNEEDRVEASTQVTSQWDDEHTNTDDKHEEDEIEASTQVSNNATPKTGDKSEVDEIKSSTLYSSQEYGIEANTYLPNQTDDVKLTPSVSKQDNNLEVSTYDPNQEATSENIQKLNVEATTYSVTESDNVTFVPVMF